MINLFDFIFGNKKKDKTANNAKERLKIILAHERSEFEESDISLSELQKEIFAVISKYIKIQDRENITRENVTINRECVDGKEILEVNIVLPQAKLK